jgi:hypothetical protein
MDQETVLKATALKLGDTTLKALVFGIIPVSRMGKTPSRAQGRTPPTGKTALPPQGRPAGACTAPALPGTALCPGPSAKGQGQPLHPYDWFSSSCPMEHDCYKGPDVVGTMTEESQSDSSDHLRSSRTAAASGPMGLSKGDAPEGGICSD